MTCAPIPAAREAMPRPHQPYPTTTSVRPANKNVGRANDAVERRLSGAVAIVEHVFGQRVVHCKDRIRQHAVALHRAQANHAGRRLLASADQLAELILMLRENRRNEVAAVVHRDLRMRRDHRLDVRIIRRVVFALDRVRRDAVVARAPRQRRLASRADCSRRARSPRRRPAARA